MADPSVSAEALEQQAAALLAKIKSLSAKQEQSRHYGPAECRRDQLAVIAEALAAQREALQYERSLFLARCEAEVAAQREALTQLRQALGQALDEWEYASGYKGEHLARKHGDSERIAELRALLASPEGER